MGDDNFDLPGDDIHDVYLAKDDNFMYFGIEIADGAPLSGGNGHMHFQFSLTANGSDLVKMENHFALFTSVLYHVPTWGVHTALHVVHPFSGTGVIPVVLEDYEPATHLGIGADFVEWKIPIDDCMMTSGKYAEAWTHYESLPDVSDAVMGTRIK